MYTKTKKPKLAKATQEMRQLRVHHLHKIMKGIEKQFGHTHKYRHRRLVQEKNINYKKDKRIEFKFKYTQPIKSLQILPYSKIDINNITILILK